MILIMALILLNSIIHNFNWKQNNRLVLLVVKKNFDGVCYSGLLPKPNIKEKFVYYV